MSRASRLRRYANLWPPFLFTGIRVEHLADDWRRARVRLKLRWYNRNYVGTHFGGSLFAMTDPWYMLMLMPLLGRDYFVWDQQAGIEFIAPGRGKVTARFRIDDATLAEIRERTANGEKYLPQFVIDIVDEQNELIARVTKTLYVRKKPTKR